MKNKQIGFGALAAIVISTGFLALTSATCYADTAPATKKADEAQATTTANAADAQSANKTNTDTSATDKSVDDQLALLDTDSQSEEVVYNKDPLERINRAIFVFNDKLDIYIVKPIAELYNDIVPKPLNKGIHNFFNNLGELSTIANDILQFNFFQMTNDTWRFAINSTFGFAGFVDMATRMNLPYFKNDFGLTLAKWGYKDSSYLVLPFLGSNTIRDGIGLTVDYFEFSVYPYVQPKSRRYQLLGLFSIDSRANLLQFEPVLEEAAIDKYVFMRNAYMQHRAFQIDQVKHLGYKDKMSARSSSVS